MRFSWSFFLILAATLIFIGLAAFAWPPPRRLWPWLAKPRTLWLTTAVATVWLVLVGLFTPLLVPPVPESKAVAVPVDRTIVMPTAGDQCWALFPCTPEDFSGKSIESRNGRLTFRKG